MSIAIYDTACGSRNGGDSIIMEAVYGELDSLFPLEHRVSYPTHYPLSLKTLRAISGSRIAFVGGTNLLTSRVHLAAKRNQWAVGLLGSLVIKQQAVLMGCGWKAYNEKSNCFARMFYKNILSKSHLHAVRDRYTENHLRHLGVTNVCTTGCPTMWQLTPEHCDQIPRHKSENVVFTLTDYRKSPREDAELVRALLSNYSNVFFWLQGMNDSAYLDSLLSVREIELIRKVGPSLKSYDSLLSADLELDYVGTRLHAGIRALQRCRRTLIVGIDNRALEKKVDFNLPVIPRSQVREVVSLLRGNIELGITLPFQEIRLWRSQFER